MDSVGEKRTYHTTPIVIRVSGSRVRRGHGRG